MRRDRIKYAVCSAAAALAGALVVGAVIIGIAWIMNLLERLV
nr:MAG TPA: hypothetical protein [Caudoviricetes sp.]